MQRLCRCPSPRTVAEREQRKPASHKRREELERGEGGDHDLPYRFTLPVSMPQVLAWLKLQVRVQQGDLQGEVVVAA